ncbi:POU domain class 2-associating factor 1 [Dissostichus eleginoides]|uniref:POU domain class 2-associating factor 1 n=1 Tax=Dissostichus eleginoides TaxID=100907 RepID=A0AAD9CEA8_DISEL|nr:POU domain class 2-associating factor 1 [Dissostichus eleginoides]
MLTISSITIYKSLKTPKDKQRVYQGVRVKTTVKELLQRHRAHEANSKKVKTISQACSDLQGLCPSTFQTRYEDPPSAISPDDARGYGARAFQLRTASFPVPDSSCGSQMHEEGSFNDIPQQFGDMMLPGNGYSGNNNTNNSSGGSYSASLPAPPTLPLPWCHALSSDADYYGHGMAPCSSPELLKLCTPVDHNSYSPQDSFSSSSSSSCYDSPTRMDPGYPGLPSEHFHFQHCTPQDLCSLPYWPGPQDSFSAPQFAPYYNPTDYPYACPAEENYFRRDLQMTSEMCYNVL